MGKVIWGWPLAKGEISTDCVPCICVTC
jgi:hypothetical protein